MLSSTKDTPWPYSITKEPDPDEKREKNSPRKLTSPGDEEIAHFKFLKRFEINSTSVYY